MVCFTLCHFTDIEIDENSIATDFCFGFYFGNIDIKLGNFFEGRYGYEKNHLSLYHRIF